MIYLEHVKKGFPGLFQPVLKGVTLHVEPGEFCVMIGANGCGKSTLLKIISQVFPPDSGTFKRGGSVAQVTQDLNLGTAGEMSLFENMALGEIKKPKLLFYKRHKKSIIEKLEALGLGLEKFINLPLNQLSGGQRQVIATLMAVHSGHPILLLDEHTSALDPNMQHFLMEYTQRQVMEKQLTTLMITHKIDDALRYGDRLLMLHQGNILLDIKKEEKKRLQAADIRNFFTP